MVFITLFYSKLGFEVENQIDVAKASRKRDPRVNIHRLCGHERRNGIISDLLFELPAQVHYEIAQYTPYLCPLFTGPRMTLQASQPAKHGINRPRMPEI